MIYVDVARCSGCGACVSVCPTDAISLRNEAALIDENLCTACEACRDVCPQDAILSVEPVESVPNRQVELAEPVPVEVTTARSKTTTVPAPLEWALPAVGSALLWTGREILPRLASLAAELWDRRAPPNGQVAPGRKGGRQRRRQRQRGRR